MTIGVSFVACGDDTSPAEEARDDVCDARRDLVDASDELTDVTESIDERWTAAGNLTEAQRAEVQRQVDAITTALGAIGVSDLGSLGTTLDTIRKVSPALDAIGNTRALDCS